MSKQKDGAFALLALLAAIAYFAMEYWYIVLPIILVVLILYFLRKHIEKKEEDLYYRAITTSEIDDMDGLDFEHYVSKLLINDGFEARVTTGSNDFGVDIVATKEGNKYAIQVKRQQSNVSRRAVSDAVAGMSFYNCTKSMVITNSYYSKGASELASANNCELVDRDELAKWIVRLQESINKI